MEIGLITSNVSADFLTPPGVPSWDERKQPYAQVLQDAQALLIGLQEVTPRQLAFFQSQFSAYTALSVPVIDPDPELVMAWRGKYGKFGFAEIPSPYELILFYKTTELMVLDSGYWWLSPTPQRPSIGFGNIAPRAVQWAHFRHRDSGQGFIVFNTHLDHRCLDAMTQLCCQKFVDFISQGVPLLFIGDLNINPTNPNYTVLLNQGWHDSYGVVSDGDNGTFLYDLPNIPGGRIDHILYQGAGLTPLTWARLKSPDPARRLSDHDPVYARFALQVE